MKTQIDWELIKSDIDHPIYAIYRGTYKRGYVIAICNKSNQQTFCLVQGKNLDHRIIQAEMILEGLCHLNRLSTDIPEYPEHRPESKRLLTLPDDEEPEAVPKEIEAPQLVLFVDEKVIKFEQQSNN